MNPPGDNSDTTHLKPTLPLDSPEEAEVVIGPYHLIQKIGQGGMGEVWLAEQKLPIRRRVAVKLIKSGMDTREVVARFESERQALALMDHPAIAKVFDAGSTPEGRPYFVLEYVPGSSITTWCDNHKLTTCERLELFIQVCEGVQHAHQKAIIHRDLKPSNILISELDGKPVPKIIDFGVAKATSHRLTAETLLTRVGQVIGTPEYISPEQADSTGEDVDTRTDVYSLGVVLYQLLVGALPLEFGKLSLAELLHKLREQDALSPSTKVLTMGEQAVTPSNNRGTDPTTLARVLRGDLDAITLKALEKDRARRYATPSELAADIGRYLRYEPILARPASVTYRARKYVRRHRIVVTASAVMLLMLIFFVAAQAFQLQRTMRERDRANRERDRAKLVTDFMTKMFAVSDPSQARGNSITAREILDKASHDIDTSLSRDPELQAQMMDIMGTVYYGLGLYPRAHALVERAVQIRSRVLGPNHPDTLLSKHRLGGILDGEGRFAEAEKMKRETLDARRRVLGPEHPETLRSAISLSATIERQAHEMTDTPERARRYAEAEKLERDTLEITRRVHGAEHADTLASLTNLASTLAYQGRYSEAEKLQRETLEIQRRVLGPEFPATLGTLNNLAFSLEHQARYAEAEKLYAEALNIQRRVLGPEHPLTLLSMDNFAHTLSEQKRYAESEKVYRATVDGRRRVLGPNHPDTAGATYELGCVLALQGRLDEALSTVRSAIDHGLDVGSVLEMDKDDDLANLRGDPRFRALLAYGKELVMAAQKQ